MVWNILYRLYISITLPLRTGSFTALHRSVPPMQNSHYLFRTCLLALLLIEASWEEISPLAFSLGSLPLPKMRDLILQKQTEPLLDLFKTLFLIYGHSSYPVRPGEEIPRMIQTPPRHPANSSPQHAALLERDVNNRPGTEDVPHQETAGHGSVMLRYHK